MNPRPGLVAVLLALSLQIAITDAPAQGTRESTAHRPGWLPRGVSDSRPVSGADRTLYLTAAEKAVVLARLESIESLFYSIPELAHPDGFEVEPWFVIDHQNGDQGVVTYQFSVAIYVPTKKAAGGDATTGMSVIFNFKPNHLFLDNQARWGPKDERGRQSYMEEFRGDPFPGATLVYGRMAQQIEKTVAQNAYGTTSVVFTRGGVSPWLTLTREEFYKATIFEMEGKNGAKLAENRAAFAKTPYEQWLADAPQRKKEREEMHKMITAMQGAEAAAKARKTLEDSDIKIEAQLKADDARDRIEYQKMAEGMDKPGNGIRAALDSMSVTERNLPAIIDGFGTGATGYGMAASEGPYTHRVVTPNLALWRPRESRIEVNGVVLQFAGSGSPNLRNVVWQTYKNLDWDAIRALVTEPN